MQDEKRASEQASRQDAYEDLRAALRKMLAHLEDPQPETQAWRVAMARARIDLVQEIEFGCP
jgi:hypothetical protein